MTSKFKKIEIAIILGAFVVLAAIWAINGYEDTWQFVTLGIIVIPASWFFSKKNKNK